MDILHLFPPRFRRYIRRRRNHKRTARARGYWSYCLRFPGLVLYRQDQEERHSIDRTLWTVKNNKGKKHRESRQTEQQQERERRSEDGDVEEAGGSGGGTLIKRCVGPVCVIRRATGAVPFSTHQFQELGRNNSQRDI